MQRGGASSVPRMRTMLGVTGKVIASGTPSPQAKAPPASSAGWKSTRKLTQQAPQLWQTPHPRSTRQRHSWWPEARYFFSKGVIGASVA